METKETIVGVTTLESKDNSEPIFHLLSNQKHNVHDSSTSNGDFQVKKRGNDYEI